MYLDRVGAGLTKADKEDQQDNRFERIPQIAEVNLEVRGFGGEGDRLLIDRPQKKAVSALVHRGPAR
jgi:hypothetical protein